MDLAANFMDTRFNIRDYQPGDLEGLLDMDARLFGVDAWSRLDFQMMQRQWRHIFWVACCGEVMAGYAAAFPRWRCAYVASIGVDVPFQRQGLGRQLMEGVHQVFAQRGYRQIKLHVRADNAGAIHLYHRLGYEEQKTVPQYYHDGSAALLMRAALLPRNRIF